MGGGVQKVLTLVEGGSKSFGGLKRGGSKKFDDKNFQLPGPHQSIYEHSLKVSKIVSYSKHGKFLIWSCIVQSYTFYA